MGCRADVQTRSDQPVYLQSTYYSRLLSDAKGIGLDLLEKVKAIPVVAHTGTVVFFRALKRVGRMLLIALGYTVRTCLLGGGVLLLMFTIDTGDFVDTPFAQLTARQLFGAVWTLAWHCMLASASC